MKKFKFTISGLSGKLFAKRTPINPKSRNKKSIIGVLHGISLFILFFQFAFPGLAQHTISQVSINTQGSASSNVQINDNKFDNAGNQYVCGWFIGTNVAFGNGKTATSNGGSKDIFLAKYNSSNQCQWVVAVGGPEAFDEAHSLAIDNLNGRVLLTGDVRGESVNFNPLGATPLNVEAPFVTNSATPQPTAGFFFASYQTSNGHCAWAFAPNEGSGNWRANQNNDIFKSNFKQVVTDANGDVFFAGGHLMNPDFDPSVSENFSLNIGGGTTFLAKYSKDGAFLFAKEVYQTGGNSMSIASGLQIATFSGQKAIFLAGDNGQFDGEAFVKKINPSTGEILWQNLAYSRGIDHSATSLAVDASGQSYFSWIAEGPNPTIRKLNWEGEVVAENASVSYHTDLAWNPVNGFLYGVAIVNGTPDILTNTHIETIDPASLSARGKTVYPISGSFRSIAFFPNGDAAVAGSFNSPSISLGGTSINRIGAMDGFFARISACITPDIQPIIGQSNNFCIGNTYTFQVPNVTQALSYQWILPVGWTLASGSPSNANTIQVVATTKSGLIKVRATTSCAQTIYSEKNLFGELSLPVISGNHIFCSATIRNFSIEPIEGATSYQWTYDGVGSLLTDGPDATTALFLVGDYSGSSFGTIQVQAFGACNNSQVATRQLVFQYPKPNEIYGGPGIPCVGEDQVFVLRPMALGIPTFAQMVLDESASSLPPGWTIESLISGFSDFFSFRINPSSIGTATLVFTATNNCGTVTRTFTCTSKEKELLFYDADGDGHGDPESGLLLCNNSGGYVTLGDDCNDNDPAVYTEKWWFKDSDGDGYGNPAISVFSCSNPSVTSPPDFVLNWADCNDENPLEYNFVWYLDEDHDGFGNPLVYIVSCSNPSTEEQVYVRNGRDCDDQNATISPREFEVNDDGIDNDCDGIADEGMDPPGTTYCDIDEDGFGDPGCPIFPTGSRTVMKNGVLITLSENQTVANNTDCDDTDPLINPLAFEFSNGRDNDCNGLVDDTLSNPMMTWYLDSDNDQYGDFNISTQAEEQPQGFVAIGGDCDDNNPNVNPGAEEICANGIDDNCDGLIDENNPVLLGAVSDKQFCPGQQVAAMPFVSNSMVVWSNSNTSIGLPASGEGLQLPAFEATNAGNTDLIASIILIPKRSNSDGSVCLGMPDTFLITIKAKPVVNAGSDQTLEINSGSVSLSGIPSGGTWSGIGVSPTGNFSTNQSVGFYPLIYSVSVPCPASDTVVIQLINSAPGQVAQPLIIPGTGSYEGPQSVTISCSTPGATIYYTTNGNTPLITTWPNSFTKIYSGPFQVLQSTTVKAIAVASGLSNSAQAIANLVITSPGICATPTFNPPSGTYSTLQLVAISSTPGSSIYYTTNGNNPLLTTPNSFTLLYSGPISVSKTMQIKAIAVKEGLLNSAMATANYQFSSPAVVQPVQVSPGSGSYPGPLSVSMTCPTEGAQIYYTTNGNSPRFDVPNSFTILYTGPFLLNANTTVKAVAVKAGLANSTTQTVSFTITSAQACAAPTFSPPPGTYGTGQLVTLSTATEGADIYFTTNGNVPRLDVPNSFTIKYTSPFLVSKNTTVRALAVKEGFLNSSTAVGVYSIGAARFANSGTVVNGKRTGKSNPESHANWKVALFPNPNNGQFKLNVTGLGREKDPLVEIVSSTGQIILQERWLGNHEMNFDLAHLKTGIYTLRIYSGSGQKLVRFQKI